MPYGYTQSLTQLSNENQQGTYYLFHTLKKAISSLRVHQDTHPIDGGFFKERRKKVKANFNDPRIQTF